MFLEKKSFFESHRTLVHISIGILIGVGIFCAYALSKGGDPIMLGYGGGEDMVSEKTSFSFGAPSAVSSAQYRGMVADGVMPPPVVPSILGEQTADRKVIQNGSLELVVKRTEDAVSAIKGIAVSLGGFVENANIYETSDNKKAGSMTVRVPAGNLEKAMSEAKLLAVKVDRESVDARDVTDQYIDIEIRLKNMRAEEAQYRAILARAEKIDDVLNVTARLSEVRQRIESAEGQLDYLSRQVDMSVLYIGLLSEADVEVFGVVWSPLAVIKESARDGLQSIVDFINVLINVAFQLPAIALVLAVGVAVLWTLWKIVMRFKKKPLIAKVVRK